MIKVGLGDYKSNLQNQLQTVHLAALQTHEFTYPVDSIAAVLFINAIGASGNFYVDLISEKRVCVDTYGTIFSPKGTRVNC